MLSWAMLNAGPFAAPTEYEQTQRAPERAAVPDNVRLEQCREERLNAMLNTEVPN